MPASGKGNRTEVKEPAIRLQPQPSFPPMDDIVGDTRPPPLKPLAAYVADLADAARRDEALHGLMVLRDKAAGPPLVELLNSAEQMSVETRGRVCQAIALCLPPPEAFNALLPVVRQEDAVKWLAGNGGGRRTIASLVAHLAGEANYRAAIPDLVAVCRRGVGRWNKPTFLRAFGRLRAQEAVPLCVAALAEHSDVSASAAWALGEIGDTSVVPNLVSAVEARLARSRFQAILYAEAAVALGKLGGKTPDALALLEKLARHEDEEVRGLAAEALGKVGGPGHASMLLRAAEGESFPWVRERMMNAARDIAQREGKPAQP